MRNAIVTLSFLFIVSAYSLGQLETTSRERESTANAKDEKEIPKVLTEQAEAWNRHDAKAFSMVFAEDADFTNVVGMSAHGRVEIEKFHAPMFATRFKDTHLKITNTKIRFIKPDVAAVDGWWEMTGAKTQEGKEIPLRRGC